jgi:hypothetical protein
MRLLSGKSFIGAELMALRMSAGICLRAALAGSVVVIVACGTREPATDADRLALGRKLVHDMSVRLAEANAIRVTTSEVRDDVRLSGSKDQLRLAAIYTVRRPDRFHTTMSGGRGLESWYNGKTLTLASHPHRVFAQAPMPETIDRTLDALGERYDMALPMGDLLYGSAEQALLSDTTTGGYAGVENVGATRCAHLVFQDVGVDWELWLPVQGEPVPKRFKVVQKRRSGQPAVDVTFTAWNFAPPIDDKTFVPKVPEDYEGIAVLQRAAAVKKTAGSAGTTGTDPKK